jgi:hypothetical protein
VVPNLTQGQPLGPVKTHAALSLNQEDRTIIYALARRLHAARPWNKDKLVGPKPPLRPSHVWSIRTKLQMEGLKRDLALFNLAIDSKLRGLRRCRHPRR